MLVATTGVSFVLASRVAIADVILGTEDNDELVGTEVADKINALGGADLVYGDPTSGGPGGDDEIDGGAGDDELWGESGADTVVGSDGSDIVAGNFTDSGDNQDIFYGDAGFLQTSTEPGDDFVESGEDRIYGGTGMDILNARNKLAGRDIVDCGGQKKTRPSLTAKTQSRTAGSSNAAGNRNHPEKIEFRSPPALYTEDDRTKKIPPMPEQNPPPPTTNEATAESEVSAARAALEEARKRLEGIVEKAEETMQEAAEIQEVEMPP